MDNEMNAMSYEAAGEKVLAMLGAHADARLFLEVQHNGELLASIDLAQLKFALPGGADPQIVTPVAMRVASAAIRVLAASDWMIDALEKKGALARFVLAQGSVALESAVDGVHYFALQAILTRCPEEVEA